MGVSQHSQHIHSAIKQQNMDLITLQKKVITYSAFHKTTLHTHTCFWSLYPPYVTATLYVYMILCLHTTQLELSQPGNHGTLAFGAQPVLVLAQMTLASQTHDAQSYV